ncbi:MAG TPA: S49 family peptidase [Burkholderiaceae bacterium]|nr:S49 family peptidase [Burkholderiaceae bacterium]
MDTTGQDSAGQGHWLMLLNEMRAWREEVHAERAALLREQRSERRWRTAFQVLFFGLPVALSLLYFLVFAHSAGWSIGPLRPVVGVVRIDGTIEAGAAASADRLVPKLEEAFRHPRTVGVVLAIDSPGGQPAEAQRIADAIERLRKETGKHTIASIGNVGASAAYLIAVRADRIYTASYSLVGSIGAVMSAWDLHRAAQRLHVEHRSYASGELKTMLNPFQPPSRTAENKARELVQGVGAMFLRDVQARRGDALKTGTRIDTGEVWYGEEAVRLGLADEVATLETAIAKHWPQIPMHDFTGRPRGTGVLFSELPADLAQRVADRVAASFVSLR